AVPTISSSGSLRTIPAGSVGPTERVERSFAHHRGETFFRRSRCSVVCFPDQSSELRPRQALPLVRTVTCEDNSFPFQHMALGLLFRFIGPPESHAGTTVGIQDPVRVDAVHTRGD